MPSSSKQQSEQTMSYIGFQMFYIGILLSAFIKCLSIAYNIRLHAINEYGLVIHEFDPWFNFRATQYLWDNGASAFFQWFDYMAWYPLGRPVGTTIYPGMQFTAVYLKRYFMDIFMGGMSLNDVCCYMPAWFGAVATTLTALMGYECTVGNDHRSIFGYIADLFRPLFYGDNTSASIGAKKGKKGTKKGGSSSTTKSSGSNSSSSVLKSNIPSSPALEVGLCTAAVMCMVPAHLMRSIGGGYDNESVAVTAMCLTFYLWVRTLRSSNTKLVTAVLGSLSGIAYFYMAAVWGGYVFVLNMVGVHAAVLFLLGRFTPNVHVAYTAFYLVGTTLAIQIPVVGWTPLKSLEQLGPCAVFLVYQLLALTNYIAKKRGGVNGPKDLFLLRVRVFSITILLLAIMVHLLAPTGYFGPFSSRIRGLFVKHTKTGNPLVDSVAEHQPANPQAYYQYLHFLCYVAPAGFGMTVLLYLNDATSFLVCYGLAAFFFSNKMVRLVILLGPISSVLSGVALGRVLSWCVARIVGSELLYGSDNCDSDVSNNSGKAATKKKKANDDDALLDKEISATSSSRISGPFKRAVDRAQKSSEGRAIFTLIALGIMGAFSFYGMQFQAYCWELSAGLSHPAIMFKATTNSGETVIVDDYRDAYFWLRDNTPKDARILAWWDYGYQITGISNRTTIADGNTWNHEHIALLGMILTGPEKEGHRIARHLADYVLLWAGGGGDDLAKAPHLARIANSVYRHMCPGDPTCRGFGFMDQHGTPSKMMSESFLYKLHSNGYKEGVVADPNRFREVHRTKYGKVRIYKILGVSKESKAWVADKKNKICDVEGGWYCRGQYPPALNAILSQRKDFAQLEDFNVDNKDADYQKAYFDNLNDPQKAKISAIKAQAKDEKRRKKAASAANTASSKPSSTQSKDSSTTSSSGGTIRKTTLDPDVIAEVYNTWEDTDETTLMWRLISTNAVDEMREWLEADPISAFIRSSDGRGPMWWAYEYKNDAMVKLLREAGVGYRDIDKFGKTPVDMAW